MKHLSLTNILVQTKAKKILSIDSLSIEKGRLYGIVGPSGSGKSTLLRVINRLVQPTTGTMDFFGTPVDLPTTSYLHGLRIQRRMALVAQKPIMFDTTVFENVAIGLRYRKLLNQEILNRTSTALELVGLSDLAKQRAATLSGGEAQRIALARAFVLQPELLLLDEATSNLDPINVSIIEKVIQHLRERSDVAIMMVTHNLMQAKRLSTDCIFIHQGNVVESRDKASFFESPNTTELQAFLSGQMVY